MRVLSVPASHSARSEDDWDPLWHLISPGYASQPASWSVNRCSVSLFIYLALVCLFYVSALSRQSAKTEQLKGIVIVPKMMKRRMWANNYEITSVSDIGLSIQNLAFHGNCLVIHSLKKCFPVTEILLDLTWRTNEVQMKNKQSVAHMSEK